MEDTLRNIGLVRDFGLRDSEIKRISEFMDKVKALSTDDVNLLSTISLRHLNDKGEAEKKAGYRTWEEVWKIEPSEAVEFCWQKLANSLTKPPIWPEANNITNSLHTINEALHGVFYQDRISKETYDFLVRNWVETFGSI